MLSAKKGAKMVQKFNNDNADNLNHLKFDTKKVKFYDEDIKKMESMNLEERVAYKAKLKAEKRYTYEE